MKPDKHEQLGKGRLRLDPSYQLTNIWKLIAENNARVDDQIETLLKRLKPTKEFLVKLVSTGNIKVHLRIVRHFDDPAGEEEVIDNSEDYVRLPGQHHLLGWGISSADLAFLVSVKADLDVDEYN